MKAETETKPAKENNSQMSKRSKCSMIPSCTSFVFHFLSLPLMVLTGSHSLWTLSTLIIGETPFPEFSAVVMLDDIQLGYYDSTVGKIIHRQYKSEHVEEEQRDGRYVFGEQYASMQKRASLSLKKLNNTRGIHVQQRVIGCELLDNGIAGPLRSWDAFNGVNEREVQYSREQQSFHVEDVWSYIGKNQLEWLYVNIYSELCIKTLKNYLHARKYHVMRKVKPRVRLIQQALKASGGLKITCLATGFYPRHINLTLLRDGQPVPDHQITGGELLPNGDETYQMRKSLEVSTEELQRHHYKCTAQHLSLDNKLDIDLKREWNSVPTPIVSATLVTVFVCLVGACGVYFICRRKHTGQESQSSVQSDYTAASTGETQTSTT